MSRMTVHTLDSAPPASRPLVQQALNNNGFVPNLIGVLAEAPVALETYLTVAGIQGRATLTLADREVVQITAARIHGCGFCVAGHTAVATRKANLPAAQVLALQNGTPVGDARLDAVAAFTTAVIATRGAVSDAALSDWRAAGFQDGQALEVVLGVSLATLCNFANNLAQSDINPELQPFAHGTFTA